MSNSQSSQDQQTQQERDRARSRDNPVEPFSPAQPFPTTVPVPQISTKQTPKLKLEKAKVTAGRSGERNITFEWFWVQVGNNFPCGFKVKTVAGNELEVTLEQLSYKRIQGGKGAVTTQVVPVAPIGTRGKMIARDVTTGEVVEQPWLWYRLGFFGGLWDAIKKLFFKPS
jgi:hypothetical protein